VSVNATSSPQGLRNLAVDLEFSFADEGGRGGLGTHARSLLTLRGQAVLLFRLAQSASSRSRLLGLLVRYLAQVITGCSISTEAAVGPGLCLPHPTGVVIGSQCRLGSYVKVMQGVTVGASREGSPIIGDHVYIGPGAKVLGGVEVGSYASIGANAVVIEDVPEHSFVAGVPARVIRRSRHAPAADGTSEVSAN
jgi:serine O-acetyltransferase